MYNSNSSVTLVSIFSHLQPRKLGSIRRESQARDSTVIVRSQVGSFGRVWMSDVEDVDVLSSVEGVWQSRRFDRDGKVGGGDCESWRIHLVVLELSANFELADRTHKAGIVQQIDKLLRLLHEPIDTLVDLGHTNCPDSAGYPPGIPMSGSEL